MLGLYVDFWQESHGASDREVRFIVQLISALFAINSISNWAQICCHKNFHPFVSGLYPKSHYIDFIPLPQYNPSKNVFFKKKKKKTATLFTRHKQLYFSSLLLLVLHMIISPAKPLSSDQLQRVVFLLDSGSQHSTTIKDGLPQRRPDLWRPLLYFHSDLKSHLLFIASVSHCICCS